jgi:hypothetical protein
MNKANGLHVDVDTDSISMAEAIRAAAPLVPCVVLTGRPSATWPASWGAWTPLPAGW